MKGSIGISDYQRDQNGQRISCSPMYHYPDYCPFYDENQTGDCWAQCSTKESWQRECIQGRFQINLNKV